MIRRYVNGVEYQEEVFDRGRSCLVFVLDHLDNNIGSMKERK